MSDIDTIKARVRKLMTLANDGAATDGEIDTAMRLAAGLLDKHHLSASDLETEGTDEELEMGETSATSLNAKFSTWESTLGRAIEKLFGCVKWYLHYEKRPARVNGIVKMDAKGNPVYGRRVCWYGPLVECQEAASLFEEWSRSIATMGVARWGGCFRGDGAAYCYGFAKALLDKASAIHAERSLVQGKPIAALPGQQTTAITLLGRYDLLRERAETWLKEEKGVNLRSGSARTGYSGTGGEAYAEGRSHGTAAVFARNARRRQLPA